MATASDQRRQLKRALRRLDPPGKGRIEGIPWAEEAGVQGFGIAKRVTEDELQPELVLKVYVERKQPRGSLQSPVPPRFRVPGTDLTVETDVEEIGRVEVQNGRTLRPGIGLSHVKGTAGTAGCMVRHPSDPSAIFVLSNAHVLTEDGAGAIDDAIVSPGAGAGGTEPADRIGRLTARVPYLFSDVGYFNTVDAAIAKLDVEARAVIPRIGIPVGVGPVRRDMVVQKTGAHSGYTLGLVKDIDHVVATRLRKPDRTWARLGFRNQVLCSRFTDEGDSGSLVVNQSGKAVGLHFAAAPQASIFNRIGNVVRELGIQLITSPINT